MLKLISGCCSCFNIKVCVLTGSTSAPACCTCAMHVDCRQEGKCPPASLGPKFRVSDFNIRPKSHVFENKVCKKIFVLQREEVSIKIGVRTWTEFS